MTFSALPPLRDVAAALSARKSLGQHFLLDQNVTRRIVALAGDLAGRTVFEIGPGPGGLTRALLESQARRIVAVEKDPRCVAALDSLRVCAQGRLELVEGDALNVDLAAFAQAPRVIVANLPYNVGTPLLIGWLRNVEAFESLTLMFQAEVAERILAKPGTKAYGRLSVVAQFCCVGKKVMALPARAFTPPPKVASSVVRLTPRLERPADVSFAVLERLTAAAFGQRRKMVRSSLKVLGGEALLERAGIDPARRAEELSVADFENLARAHDAGLRG